MTFSTDDERNVLSVNESGSPRVLGPLDYKIEGLCSSRRHAAYDVFLTDGDGGIHHYVTDLTALAYMRSLPVNPDVDVCAIDADGDFVYYVDPATGVWRSATNPETDIAHEAVALFSPWGQLEAGATQIDTRYLAASRDTQVPALETIVADRETAPVRMHGDVADDPAVLVNPLDPGASLILGADKAEGLRVYDLGGREIQFLPVGRLNNVDVTGARTGAGAHAIAAASNRTHHRVDVFHVDLGSQHVTPIGSWPLALEDPYGLCLRKSGELEVFVGDTTGLVQRWSLVVEGMSVQAALVEEFRFGSQTEGCYVDPERDLLYVGEEAVGVWEVPLAAPAQRRLIVPVTETGLIGDVEGIAGFESEDGERLLIVSSQGDDSYVIVDPATSALRVKFRVDLNLHSHIDGVSETDGVDVTTAALPGFPKGLLVLQDGRNLMPPAPQNFKLIDLGRVFRLLH